MERAPRRPFCADISAGAAEPLTATASRVDHWLLVEYRGLWNRDVLAGSLFSARLQAALREQLAALPRSRLLFIRRPERRARAGRMVYLARSTEQGSALDGVEVGHVDELVGLDLAAVARPVGHPLLAVCTHGKRDRCCARYGRPLYDRLVEEAEEDWVWQSTHVGGDRFAGNLVCLPQGLTFGRVGVDDVWPLLDEYLAGRIYLDRYRGRSCYSFAVQAAEHAVRDAGDVSDIDGVRLVSSRRLGHDSWKIRFLVRSSDEVHEVAVEQEAGELTYLTCDAEALRHPRRYVAKRRHVVSRRRPEGSPRGPGV
jgi:hypothetical protein